MPKKNKGSQKAAAKTRAKAPSGSKALVKQSSIPYASTRRHKPIFEITSKQHRGSPCLGVHVKDMLAPVYRSGVLYSSQDISDLIPFSLSYNNRALGALGQILPKLQGIGMISSRYQVKKAILHYECLTAASTDGAIGGALVPGVQGPPAAIEELGSFDHSMTCPVWEAESTTPWHNAEDRWFQSFGQAFSPNDVPFTILRMVRGTAINTRPAGLFWLELWVDFIDLRPVPQQNLTNVLGVAQAFSGAASGQANYISWQTLTNVLGDWGWSANQPYYFNNGGSTLVSRLGAGVAADGAQLIEWFGDLLLEAVTTEEKSVRPLLEWTESPPEEKETWPTRYPSEFKQGPRIRVNCKFKSLKEAMDAQSRGFDPKRVVDSSPNAAGDFTVYLNAQPEIADGTILTLASWTISGGTGAVETKLQTSFELNHPSVLAVQIVPTGTENRILGALSSQDYTTLTSLASSTP